MRISIVIPAYNEEKIIKTTVETLFTGMKEYFTPGDFEIIFVDDGSTDNTRKAAEQAALGKIGVRVIGYPVNQGKGCAVKTGMLAARGAFILFTDCDLAYGTKIIFDFLSKYESIDADVIIGSRRLTSEGFAGYTPLRKLMSKTYFEIIKLNTGFKYSDSQCGIKGFSYQAAKKVFGICRTKGFAFDLEALMIAESEGYTIAELPVSIVNHRESKVHPFRDTLRMLREIRRIKNREKQRIAQGHKSK